MKIKIVLIFFVICFYFLSCSSDNENETVILQPVVVTKDIQVLSEGGVIVTGNFQNFDNQSVLGFEFFLNSHLIRNIDITNPTQGINSVSISMGLYAELEYSYRAYIRTSNETYYGVKKSFISNGSVLPTFSGINPNKGSFNDNIELIADNDLEETTYSDVRVYFNGVEGSVSEVSGNKVKCTVPYYYENHVANISVNFFGKSISTTLKYELLPPIIDSVNPQMVTFRDEIIISGKNFENLDPSYLEVNIDGIKANVISKSKTSLVVQVPDNLTSVTSSIRVVSNLQETIFVNAITLKPPTITSYPDSVHLLEEIEIRGENFNPINNTVYFGDSIAVNPYVSQYEINKFIVRVPTGPYSGWQTSIKVKTTNDELISTKYPLNILDPAIKINNNATNATIDGYQILNDIIYVYGFEPYNPNKFVISKYSEINNEFYDSYTLNMPIIAYVEEVISTNDGYVYLFYEKNEDNFNRINLKTYKLEPLKDFPGNRKKLLVVAYDDENIIICNGLNEDNTDLEGVFKYNILSNSWSQLDNITGYPVHMSFYAKNESYYLKGFYSEANDFYKFNGNNYVLISGSLPVHLKDYSQRFYVFNNNKFYFISSYSSNRNPMTIFDITNYTWKEVLNVRPNDSYPVVGIFSKGNYIYVQIIDNTYKYRLIKIDLNKVQ